MTENPNIKPINVKNEEEINKSLYYQSKTRLNSLSSAIENDYQSSSYDWSPSYSNNSFNSL
jgi:hypothetical protein